jgi:hypothetical protein
MASITGFVFSVMIEIPSTYCQLLEMVNVNTIGGACGDRQWIVNPASAPSSSAVRYAVAVQQRTAIGHVEAIHYERP